MVNFFCTFPQQKTLHKVIVYNVFKAGSGSALRKTAVSGSAVRKTAGSGSAKNECRSTALEEKKFA